MSNYFILLSILILSKNKKIVTNKNKSNKFVNLK